MSNTSSLLTRDDTFFGVCQGLGEDLGVPPNLLRLGAAGLLFWNPLLALGIYAALGGVVAAARWFIPDATPTAAQPAAEPAAGSGEAEPVALAA